MTGLIVVLLLVLAGVAFGVWRRRTDGRLRAVAPATTAAPHRPVTSGAPRVAADEIGAALGERATLLQFSSAFCAPCRTTRVLLADVTAVVPGVRHVEVDAESALELVRRLDVRRTPTTLLLDADGEVRLRAAGVPRRQDVVAALGTLI